MILERLKEKKNNSALWRAEEYIFLLTSQTIQFGIYSLSKTLQIEPLTCSCFFSFFLSQLRRRNVLSLFIWLDYNNNMFCKVWFPLCQQKQTTNKQRDYRKQSDLKLI